MATFGDNLPGCPIATAIYVPPMCKYYPPTPKIFSVIQTVPQAWAQRQDLKPGLAVARHR